MTQSEMAPSARLRETRDMVMAFPNETRSVTLARRAVSEQIRGLGLPSLVPSAELVVTELVANAVLHTNGPVEVQLQRLEHGVRISVADSNPALPVVPAASASSMTGRGLLLVRRVAARLGFDARREGKVVWAELRIERLPGDSGIDELVEAWADDLNNSTSPHAVHHIELGDVPTDLLLDAKAHVDNLVREFVLAASGAEEGSTAAVPAHLVDLIGAVVTRFSGPRLAIKRQALEAARRGLTHVRLSLDLGPDAIEAGEAYLKALDEADGYCRAARLLTLETPPKHRVFRHWYVGQIIEQLRRAEAGLSLTSPQSFEERLLQEIDTVAGAWATADRAARLYTVASALAGALTPEAVAEAVLTEGVAALRASGGALLLPPASDRWIGSDRWAGSDRWTVSGTVGYGPQLVAKLRAERADAELPAARALRTGEAVWMESREERDAQFPELAALEGATVSMCAVPLRIGARVVGAIRFSFSEPRLFDDDERRFVLALAAQAGQALDRTQLYRDQTRLYERLRRSLLPPELPGIPGIDVAAVYHPLGTGIEVGGDFYDVWSLGGDRWALALGEVCGTGPEAAGLGVFVRYTLRGIATSDIDHQTLLTRLNDVLLAAGTDNREQFCTVIFATAAPSWGGWKLRLTTGGHPEPLLQRRDGTVTIVPTGSSLLGVFPDLSVVSREIEMMAGERILLYTDGASEARRSGQMLGTEGLADAFTTAPRDAQSAARAIEAAVVEHSGGSLHDDMALLVVQIS